MIVNYHRPRTLEEALQLLSQTNPMNMPLAGGTAIARYHKEDFAVVDLQDLGLDQIQDRGNTIVIGATTKLQTLLDFPRILPEFKRVILHEATHNLRQAASVAGTLVAADGRSPFTTACLALDATMVLLPGEERKPLGELLNLRNDILNGKLITQIILPANVHFRYEYVSRTPADLPIVCTGVAQWQSGRTRVALGGFGLIPKLAMDGSYSRGADISAMDAYSNAGDQWASAEYRQEIARILVKRCLFELGKEEF
jgi:CO/xanthine dehydrogenase FAD-binding subunit